MNTPDSLSTCFTPDKQTVPDYFSKATDLAKSTGMNATCVQAAQSSGSSGSVSANIDTPFGSAGGQASYLQYKRNMAQSGCGQFALNLSNTMNDVSTINCTIQKNSTEVDAGQISGNSLTYKTLPLTTAEQTNQSKISQAIITAQTNIMQLAANPNLSPQQIQKLTQLNQSAMDTYKIILATYSRDVNITNSTINQTVISHLASGISITDAAASTIADKQSTVAQSTAENKLAQDLGVDALSPESKSVIQQNIKNNQYFSNQNVQDTVNKVKLTQGTNNSISITVPGNINITNSTISQSIAADMVVKALIGNATNAGLQVVSDITSSAVGTIASNGKSAGSDALIKEMGKANAAAIAAGKVSYGMGGLMALIIIVILGLGFGVVKTGSAVMNNSIFIIALVSIVVGIGFVTKSGVSYKVLGSVLILFGIAGIVFGGVMKMRLKA